MRAIFRRVQKLEQAVVPVEVTGGEWGKLADVRDKLLRLAGHRGSAAVTQLRSELDALGPTGLWIETVRCHLREHGFVQVKNESLAYTTAHALGISNQELTVHLVKGTIGKALLERLAGPEWLPILSDIKKALHLTKSCFVPVESTVEGRSGGRS